MAVDAKHPEYVEHYPDWVTMRDCQGGERTVKAEGTRYLPMPSGFKLQEDQGREMYGAYMMRAQYPEILAPTIEGMVGIIHRIESKIELPQVMTYLTEKATRDGLSLEALHKSITREVLLMGRYTLLADAPKQEEGGGEPYLAGYTAESLINWSKDRDFYVLEEARYVRTDYNWEKKNFYRVLRLEDGHYTSQESVVEGGQELQSVVIPQAQGGQPFAEIPLVVIGARNLSVNIDDPPCIGVARSSLAIYRLDADYRHQLFMSGQETLFTVGLDVASLPKVLGAGVTVALPENGDAKYVGPAGTGIEAHERAIAAERDNAVQAGARIFDSSAKAAESGEALRLRYAAQTATLTSVAIAVAQGLEKALRYIATFLGQDPNQVVVTPNLEFIDNALSPTDAEALVRMWQGRAISYETMYDNLQRGGIASAERTAAEERAVIDDEEPEPVTVDPLDDHNKQPQPAA
ncbi:DUF4055 domain-containing protein [Bradyrhizobium sp. Leo121]|uniref:DUF4055 domain-containing protein n=1 Tax=Bradyrhizobium sp. Leo121 TaxID=1571195 RepID=UPI001029C766|nr:DUF4055 domain-containing protein [Bradyrhizobium sp. Leo121]RZN30519.1 hypothetical protein CWO90_20495 [Bradyrhizobium sp. Leo121]